MMRAVAFAARLDFTLDPPLAAAIRKHRGEIAKSSPPRLIEEYYKILRAGSAEKTFRSLHELGLLEPLSAELHQSRWGRRALAVARGARRVCAGEFESAPETLDQPRSCSARSSSRSVFRSSGRTAARRYRGTRSSGAKRPAPSSWASFRSPAADVERLRQIACACSGGFVDISATPILACSTRSCSGGFSRKPSCGSTCTATRRKSASTGAR